MSTATLTRRTGVFQVERGISPALASDLEAGIVKEMQRDLNEKVVEAMNDGRGYIAINWFAKANHPKHGWVEVICGTFLMLSGVRQPVEVGEIVTGNAFPDRGNTQADACYTLGYCDPDSPTVPLSETSRQFTRRKYHIPGKGIVRVWERTA